MTSDGRPSRIYDIRYFYGATRDSRYLEGHQDAVAFGRRLAWLLNGEGVSLGSYTALYVLLTTSLAPGHIQITDEGGAWWQRYTQVGVSPDFPNVPDSSEVVMRGTIAAMKAIRPDIAPLIEDAEQIVREHRENLRFLLKTRQTKRFVVEISCGIAVWPQPSLLFVSLTDRSSDVFLEAPAVPVQFYDQAFDLAGAIRVTEAAVELRPNESVAAKMISTRNGGPIVKSLSEFEPRERPIFSKLIKRRS
jgi:hypothetical protein